MLSRDERRSNWARQEATDVRLAASAMSQPAGCSRIPSLWNKASCFSRWHRGADALYLRPDKWQKLSSAALATAHGSRGNR